MKLEFNFASVIVGIVGYAFGGWTLALQTLVFVMCFDYITGLFAAKKKKSNKSKSGGLSSKAGFKGILKKLFILGCCSVAYRMDILLNASGLLYNAVVCFYIGNDVISVLENLVAAEIKIPKKLQSIAEAMKEEADES